MAIHLRSREELEKMYRAGLIVHDVLTALRDAVRPGITTMDLEKLAEEKIAGKPGKPAFKGYRGYPATICTSVNSEIVHGIPSPKRKLREGDIVGIDAGAIVDGWHADAAITIPVGKVSADAARLIEVTEEALRIGIASAKVGGRIGDIGAAIEEYVRGQGFSVVH